MRIGLITGEYPPMQGGVGAFTQELAKALADLGHTIHVITGRQAGKEEGGRMKDEGESIHHSSFIIHHSIRRWRWPAVATIASLSQRYELDVVNIQYQAAAYDMRSPAINLLPWRLRGLVKTVVTFHDLRVPYLFPKVGRWRQAAVTFMARQAHGVIVTNSEDYQNLVARLHPSTIRQIPIGSNVRASAPDSAAVAAARARLGLTPDHFLLGYFGFLNESKGADTLLRALAQLDKRVHLVFIGGRLGSSDPDNNQAFLAHLDTLIGELGLGERVHWTGFVSDEEVSAYLRAADLMAMPYRDGVSLRRGTLMAVLAHGRPLLTTHPTTPTPELVHGQNVWFAPVDDMAELTDAVRYLAAVPPVRAQLGYGARQVADLFTWDKIAAQTAAFFQALVDVDQVEE